MYTRLSQKMTKQYFREILELALQQAKSDYDTSSNIALNKSIYKQLVDIKKTVVEDKYVYTEEEAKSKYPLGVQVVRNFDGYLDSDWAYPKMLIDIAGGIYRYPNMPEK